MPNIFYVRGAAGQWEDYRTWVVAAFTDQEKAQAWRRNAQAFADNYTKVLETEECTDFDVLAAKGITDNSPWDPHFAGHGSFWQDTVYSFFTAPLDPETP